MHTVFSFLCKQTNKAREISHSITKALYGAISSPQETTGAQRGQVPFKSEVAMMKGLPLELMLTAEKTTNVTSGIL